MNILIGVGFFVVVLAIAVFLMIKNTNTMNTRLDSIMSGVNKQLNSLTSQLNERIKEVSHTISDTHRTVGDRLDSATEIFGNVRESLGKLEETNKQIYEIGRDISSLEHLLRAPKFRGELGETMLGNILSQVLPKEHYKLQHTFDSGETVDAAIFIGDNILSIDAKFPYENFKRMHNAENENEKKQFMRFFIRDVKNRITEISSKYILPDEKTFDFGLMYVPAESLFSEITRDSTISNFAKAKKVIPVSPNTFYAYLQAICHGLKGLTIQRNIVKIMRELGKVTGEFSKFKGEFSVLGGHIRNAKQKFDDAQLRLDRFGDKLISTHNIKAIKDEADGA
ncbi:MAG: DNA recombination protein RmuC [Candidatus Omnitrophica bacterium]|nr:DNA recombination protein RmuC [Candidatus Omnitrophota bacterium]